MQLLFGVGQEEAEPLKQEVRLKEFALNSLEVDHYEVRCPYCLSINKFYYRENARETCEHYFAMVIEKSEMKFAFHRRKED